jgi:hypothetical protein
MSERQFGFYALVVGVLAFVLVRSYVHYKGGFSLSQDWLTWWQDIAALAAAIGLILVWKELAE